MSVLDYNIWDGTRWVSACSEDLSIFSNNGFEKIEQNVRVWTGSEWDILSCCPCPSGYTYNEITSDCSSAFEITGETALIVWHDTSGSFSEPALSDAAATAKKWAQDNGITKVIQVNEGNEDYLLWLENTFRVKQSVVDSWNSGSGYDLDERVTSTELVGAGKLVSANDPQALNNFIIVLNINENGSDYAGEVTSVFDSHYETLMDSYFARNRNYIGLLYAVARTGITFNAFKLHCIGVSTGFTDDASIDLYTASNLTLNAALKNDNDNIDQSSYHDYFTYRRNPTFPTLRDIGITAIVDKTDGDVFSNGQFYKDLDRALLQVGNSFIPTNVPCNTSCVCRTGYTFNPNGNPQVDACVNEQNRNITEPCQTTL